MVTSVVLLVVVILPLALAAQMSGLPADSFELDLVRVTRQDNTECTANVQCVPAGQFSNASDVSSNLVRCDGGVCVCSACFMRDLEMNRCVDCPAWPYVEMTGECGEDNRQSQRMAFLLSLFLSSTGAANFYIQRYVFGAVQLVVLLLFLGALYVMICPCCVCCGLMDKEGVCKGTCLFILLFTLSIIIVVALGLLIAGWWLADLVVFGTRSRLSGDGCLLQPDF